MKTLDEETIEDLEDTARVATGNDGLDVLADGSRVPPETRRRLEKLNQEFAYIAYGGKSRFVHKLRPKRERDPSYQMLDPTACSDLLTSEHHVKLQKVSGTEVKTVYVPLYKAWRQWPGRKKYVRADFYPFWNETGCDPAGGDVFNMWEDPRIRPKKGTWKYLQRHIWEVLCDRDPEKFRWLISWMAHLIQTTGDPQRKSPVSPVIWGKQGAGKSIVFEFLARLFGNHGMTISQTGQLVGKHNQHLMLSAFIILEEAVYAHSKASEGPLKDLLTRATLTVEPKNVNLFTCHNHCRFVFISNEQYAVPMSTDARRFQPFKVSPHRTKDEDWFKRILTEMRQGGLEAMFYDLLYLKYGEALISKPIPNSHDLAVMKTHAATPWAKFLAEWIAGEGIALPLHQPECSPGHKIHEKPEIKALPLTDTPDGNCFPRTEIAATYRRWAENSLNQFDLKSGTGSDTELITKLIELCPLIQKAERTKQRRGWKLPPLHELKTWIENDETLRTLYEQALAGTE